VSQKSAGGGVPFTKGAVPDLGNWLRRTTLQEMFSAHGHSRDFNGMRAEFIYLRVRVLALAFAVLAPLWIPIDWFLLSRESFVEILAMRLAFSAAFFALAFWTGRPHSLEAARLRLALFIIVPGLFYIGSRLALGGLPSAGVLMGYAFLPYLMVAFMAIFALTLLEGIAFALSIGLFLVAVELFFGTLLTIETLGNIWLLGLLAGIALWAQLAQLHMLLQLYREATRDALTGLVNRRVLAKWLDVEIARAQGRGAPLSILLLDLDRFKAINDTYGHLTGDAVLQGFADLLRETLPEYNLVGRYGGEEFMVVLPGCDAKQALTLAEQVRDACHGVTVRGEQGESVPFTVSVGVAQLQAGENAETLISRVDGGLYQAKESGRDMAVMAE